MQPMAAPEQDLLGGILGASGGEGEFDPSYAFTVIPPKPLLQPS